MKKYQRIALTISLVVLPLLFCQGCSKRAWYQGFVAAQEFQCNKLSGLERTRCLDSITLEYDRYERERMERLQQSD